MYANQQGCDGERVYYDGSCMIVVNGALVAQGSQFSLNDVEVVTAKVDLESVITFRAALVSRSIQAGSMMKGAGFPSAVFEGEVLGDQSAFVGTSRARPVQLLGASDEIRLGPACWLWDYLRRSKQGGFFLPLSGGIDSCSTALIVFSMCEMVYEKIVKEKGESCMNQFISLSLSKFYLTALFSYLHKMHW